MKKIFLLGFILTFSFGAVCQDSKADKIEALIELLSTEERMNNIIDNLINESLKNADAFDSAFWKEYKVRAIKGINDTLKPQIISVYDKYFTDEEINYMYEFYSSEIGQQTLIKYNQLMQELLLMGMNFGETISKEIFLDLEEKEKQETDYRINNEFTGCERFKTGKFKLAINDSTVVFYERDKNRQIETYGQGRSVSEIKWLNECRYSLTLIETNNPYDQEHIGRELIVNIYETTEDSYKFYFKLGNSEDIYEGEMTMIK